MNTIFDIQRFSDLGNVNITTKVVGDVTLSAVEGTSGNDIVNTSIPKLFIDTKKGNDRITHTAGANVTIKGGDGKDTIRAYAENAYIDGGEGNDFIDLNIKNYNASSTNNTGGATIIGGKGNDVIALDPGNGGTDAGSATGRVIVYNDGDGNDLIQGIGANDTIIIATEDGVLPVFDKQQDGENYIINIGSGKITLKSTEESVINALTFKGGKISVNADTEIFSVEDQTVVAVPTLISGKSTGDNYTGTNANTESNTVVELLAGNDKFDNNGGDTILVYGGAGNDSLKNSSGNNVTLDGGAGNDSIEAAGSDVLLIGGAGNDFFTIDSSAEGVTVNGGAGNDFIKAENTANPNYYVYGEGDGKDTIEGYKTGDTIQLTSSYVDTSKVAFSGSDFVIPVGSGSITLKDLAETNITEVTISNPDGSTTTVIQIPQKLLGTKSADTLTNEKSGGLLTEEGSEETTIKAFEINALAGNDKITNTGDYVSIFADAGNDSITLGGDSAESMVHGTINGGKGNDVVTIQSAKHAYRFEYDTADGGDTIHGLGESDTLVFGTDTIDSAISADGKNFIIVSGKTSVAVANYTGGATFYVKKDKADAEQYTIPKIWQGTKNADSLNNESSDYEILALGGSDSITNSGARVYIYGEAGDDTIISTDAGDKVTIDGGAGKDVISNSGKGASIVGGAGNDSIYNTGSALKIPVSGEGDEAVSASNVNVKIYGGAGVDTLDNTGSGVEIYGEDDNDIITNSGNNVTIDGGAGNDNISVDGNATGISVGGGKGNDTITIETVEAGSAQAHTFTYSIGDGNDNIYGFNANDVINIYDADGTTTLNTDSYKTEISDKDLIITVGTGKNAGKITLHNVVGTVSSTKINDSTVNITKITYGTEKDDSLIADSNTYLIQALAGNDTISIGSGITGTSVEGGAGNDLIIGNDKGNVYIYNDGDGNDTISGFTASDTITLGADAEFDKAKDTLASAHNFILNIGKGSIVLAGAIGSVSSVKVGNDTIDISELKPVIIGSTKADSLYGDDAVKEDAVHVSVGAGNDTVENYGSDVTVLAGAGNDSIYNEGASGILLGEAGNDTIENYADEVQIDAGAANDYIFSAGDSVEILGDAGNDTVESFGNGVKVDGGAGTDYIYSDGENNYVGGGKGNDTIEIAGNETTVYYATGDGADTVYGFTESDILHLTDADISSATADGTDVILKINSGSIKLMDMAGQTIKYRVREDAEVKTTVVSGAITGTARADKIENTYAGFSINALAGNDTITNETTGTGVKIDGGTGADFISNSASEVSIIGGTGNDIITSSGNKVTIDGGSGHDKITVGSGSDNVTVTGGKGNDTITATGAGNVLFNYDSGDGRDVIIGFKEGDTLNITSGKSTVTTVGADTVVKVVDNGSVTIKNYTGAISGNSNGNAAVPWFAEDDTIFAGGGAAVDEITAPEYSVTKIETADEADAISQLEKYIATYGSDK